MRSPTHHAYGDKAVVHALRRIDQGGSGSAKRLCVLPGRARRDTNLPADALLELYRQIARHRGERTLLNYKDPLALAKDARDPQPGSGPSGGRRRSQREQQGSATKRIERVGLRSRAVS